MNGAPVVLRGPDQSTVALIVSWLNQAQSTNQEAEGDFLNEYVDNTQQQRPQVSLGGAATSIAAPRPVFWRTRQVQQYLTSREVLDRYQEALNMSQVQQEEQPQPETMFEPSSNNPEDNISWYLDSRSESVQEGSQTDSEVYKRSDSNTSSTSSDRSFESQPQKEPPTPPEAEPHRPDESPPPQEAGPLDNPLLQAFILDLDESEMTPMLHLVANMMTPMYFNDQEAEIIRHFLLHKVENTINSIQRRMDLIHTQGSHLHIEEETEEIEETEEDSETLLEEQETEESTLDADDDSVFTMTPAEADAEVVPRPTRVVSVEEEEVHEELQVELVDDEGVTEVSMKLVKQMMELTSNKSRRTLVKKAQPLVSEKEKAVLEYFERSLRTKEQSWWNCCA